MKDILTEITPLTPDDCLFIRINDKERFDFPLHKHQELELNFVENCEGCRRIVGDSTEVLGKYDLTLVGSNLEHMWEDAPDGESRWMHEITVQFSPSLIGEELLRTRHFNDIRVLMQRARRGVAFDQACIIRVFSLVQELANAEPGFDRFIRLLELLQMLAQDSSSHTLSSEQYAQSGTTIEDDRIAKVITHIEEHFQEDIRLPEMAKMVGLSDGTFSKFFSRHTHMSLTDYVVEKRIGYAARQLVYTDNPIAEIGYDSGFKTMSNFNRLFRARKGCSPSEFRDSYRRRQIGGDIKSMRTQ